MDERQLLLRVLERRVRSASGAQRLEWSKLWLARFDVNVWRPTLFEWGAHPTSSLVELIGTRAGPDAAAEWMSYAVGIVDVPDAAVTSDADSAQARPRIIDAVREILRALDAAEDPLALAAAVDAAAIALGRDYDDLRRRVDDTGGFSDA